MIEKDVIDKLKSRETYLDEWLKRNCDAQNLVPHVQQALDFTRWEIDALSSRPEEADEIAAPTLSNVDRENQFMTLAFPMLPKFDISMAGSASGMNVAANTTVYSFVVRVGDIPTEIAQNYSRSYAQQYQELQDKYTRVEKIRTLLVRIPDSLALKRLDPAFKSFSKSKSGVVSRTATATEIRNLLDGFKGDLFALAYGKGKGNKTWRGMSEKVAKGGTSSLEYAQLLDQEKVRDSLIDRLSGILKDREGGSITNLDAIWTQTLDHIYVALNLIAI